MYTVDLHIKNILQIDRECCYMYVARSIYRYGTCTRTIKQYKLGQPSSKTIDQKDLQY